MTSQNPFIPFLPAYDAYFIDRESAVQTILERIQQGSNIAIIGNPHIGKTSLLIHTANLEDLELVLPTDQYAFVELDFQLYGEHEKPFDFWHEILRQAVDKNDTFTGVLQPLVEVQTLDKQALYRGFQQLGRMQKRVVAFLDEFDHLFNLPAFRTLDFLGALRAIVMKSGGFLLISASRLSVAQMNMMGQKYKVATRGSDLFNYLYPVHLATFAPQSTQTWLRKHLPPEAVSEVQLLAGHHPFLLQLAGQMFFQAIQNGMQPADYPTLRPKFIEKAHSQFQDVWGYLDAKAQIALMIFVLRDFQGEIKGETYQLSGVEKTLTWYQVEIKDMARRGTLEINQRGGYQIGSLAFRTWLVEHKIVGTRGEEPTEAFTQWLHKKRFKLGGLVTNEEIETIHKIWKAIPAGLIDLAKKAFLPEK